MLIDEEKRKKKAEKRVNSTDPSIKNKKKRMQGGGKEKKKKQHGKDGGLTDLEATHGPLDALANSSLQLTSAAFPVW